MGLTFPMTVVFATVKSQTEGGAGDCGGEISSSYVHCVVNMTCVVAILPLHSLLLLVQSLFLPSLGGAG